MKPEVAAYSQVFQELLRPDSLLAGNHGGMNVIALRFEDWCRGFAAEKKGPVRFSKKQAAEVERIYQDFETAIGAFAGRAVSPTMVLLCPDSAPYQEIRGWRELFSGFGQRLAETVAGLSGLSLVQAIDYEAWFAIDPADRDDAFRDGMGHIPFTDPYFHFLGCLVARRFFAATSKPYKVIVADCDNTLWGGVCGEIGAEGVDLGGPYRRIQQFLVEQAANGTVICLCSKNVEEDVWRVFDTRPDMVLKREHLVDARINWTPKSANLHSLAGALNLGLDSFIFLDDNPVEIAEVQANCPEVFSVQWPADEALVQRILDHFWVFDRYGVTAEDQKRTRMYQANVERERLLQSQGDFAAFLEELNLVIQIEPVAVATLARAAQLTNRTNQFNFTTRRRAENEIRALLDGGVHDCWTVTVSDRFGDYGLVGVAIVERRRDELYIDTFLLSCRVLGRGVEHRMLARLGAAAAAAGLASVRAPFLPTAKNEPARKFIEAAAAHGETIPGEHGFEVLFQADRLLEYRYEPPTTLVDPARADEAREKAGKRGDSADSGIAGSQTVRMREHLFVDLAYSWTDLAGLAAAVVESGPRTYPAGQNQPQPRAEAEAKTTPHVQSQSMGKADRPGGEPRVMAREALLSKVAALFAASLAVDPAQLDPTADLESYVDDSFKNVEITGALVAAFGEVPHTILFEQRSVRAVADYLVEAGLARLTEPAAVSGPAAMPAVTADHGYTAEAVGRIEQNPVDGSRGERESDIAVIGMSGRFPGADSVESLWRLLVDGRVGIGEIPPDRWDVNAFFDPEGKNPEKSYGKWGGFLEGVDRFDTRFFQITPKEAELMDPQQRLFLEVVWGLMENAGYTRATLARDTGVFVGVMAADYAGMTNEAALRGAGAYRGSDFYQIPNRVSYFLDLHGPSLAIDTACSASGTALHLACQSLRRGECRSAIVGGVNLFLHPSRFVQYAQMQFLSKDDKCRPFGDDATGTVFGEAIVALMLKPLAAARADGDYIHAVIKGSAVNSGGKTNGFTVPNPQAQAELVTQALRDAAVDPHSISYIEAHGTGTPLGDPIEIRGLTMAFAETGPANGENGQFCAIGSIKSNLGHSESCAALSGIVKILLQMRERTLVPSLHAERPNPRIPFEQSPFFVQRTTAPWSRRARPDGGVYPLRAGISSFGAGGSNAHILLEEYATPSPLHEVAAATAAAVVLLSARDEDRLAAYAGRLATFLIEAGKSAAPPRLEDIAHTLQVGRESMRHRLALVVDSIEELATKLTQFGEGKRQIERVFHGDATALKGQAALLVDGDEGREFIRLVLKNRNSAKLGQLWVMGVDIDWRPIYEDRPVHRIPLPGYPFAGERYWIPSAAPVTAVQSGGLTPLHPLLDRNDSTFAEQLFSKRFSGQELVLKHHIVGGEMVLPGVAYLEMARAGGDLANPEGRVTRIFNVVWAAKFGFSVGHDQIRLGLQPRADFVDFELSSMGAGGVRTIHAQGELGYDAVQDPATFSIADLRGRCNRDLGRDRCYQLYRDNGFAFGPAFMPIEELVHNDREALARLVLPEAVRHESAYFNLHPGMMDGALQTVIGLTAERVSSAQTPFLPFGLGEMVIHGPLPERGYAYVRQTTESASAHITKFDVWLLDEQGRTAIAMRDYSLRAVPSEHLRASSSQPDSVMKPETLFYRPAWTARPQRDSDAISFGGDFLLFAPSPAWRDHLMEKLNPVERARRIALVVAGESFASDGLANFTIRANRAEDYDRLLMELARSGFLVSAVLHAWSTEAFAAEDGARLQVQTESSGTSLVLLAQALIKHKPAALTKPADAPDRMPLFFAFTNAGDNANPVYQAAGALVRTIRLEQPKFAAKSVELTLDSAQSDPSVLLDSLLGELRRDVRGDDIEVRYRGGLRESRTMARYRPSEAAGQSAAAGPVLRPEGVYLISGGAGGLGLLFAEFLALQVKARLVLAGRSPLSPAQTARIRDLEELGARVHYVQADIAVAAEADRLVGAAKTHFGALHGVIHAAGVIADSFILKKSAAEFDLVCRPKLFGTVNLDHATRFEELDFFACFSSLSGVLGNLGQADYAFANRFLDNFTARRKLQVAAGIRHGRSLAIDWPLWREGGMAVDERAEKMLTANLGLRVLERQAGLSAFQHALDSGEPSLLAVDGWADKFEIALGLRAESAPAKAPIPVGKPASVSAMTAAPAPAAGVRPPTGSQASLVEQTETFLKEILAKETKLPVAKISSKEPLEEYGIDSVMILSLNDELIKHFGELSRTLLFEYQNLAELTGYFIESHRDRLERMFGQASPAEAAPAQMPVPAPAIAIPQATAAPSATPSGLPGLPGSRMASRFTALPAAATGSGLKNSPGTPVSPVRADVAIIGLNGRFPMAADLDQFWENLSKGVDCISEIPADRWDYRKYFDPDKDRRGKTYSKWGGFIDDMDKFDPLFFNISPREATMLDPQERIFLELAYHTIEDAGYTKRDFRGREVGVYVGVMWGQYQLFGPQEAALGNFITPDSNYASVANRVSYYFDFQGPSMTVDTMCSSSLSAIHLACEAIHSGEIEMALAGGVNLTLHPAKYLLLSRDNFTSSDGRCRSFGEGGDGYVPGEGVGAVLLKPLAQARADGDFIYGVIKGTSINHGGKTNGYTVPNPKAQGDLVTKSLTRAGISPASLSYIEAHGTGTSLGDPIEITGLVRAFKGTELAPQSVPIGSVKSNVGHLEAAAGIAGLAKVLLQMRHRRLAPSIHSKELNSNINFAATPFIVQQSLSPWPAPVLKHNGHTEPMPRRAGISSFGAGGSNAHVIIEEFDAAAFVAADSANEPNLFVLSAKNLERLAAYAQNLADYLDKHLAGEEESGYKAGSDSDLTGVLAGEIAAILRVDTVEIDAAVELAEYGFDLMAASRLSERLAQTHDFELRPEEMPATLAALVELVSTRSGAGAQPANGFRNAFAMQAAFAYLTPANVAYTLQVGREPLPERLAIVAADLGELSRSLRDYCAGRPDPGRRVEGNIRRPDQSLTLPVGDEAVEAFAWERARTGQWLELARLWVAGMAMPWQGMPRAFRPNRVPLPGYPFERTRFWYDSHEKPPKIEVAPSPAAPSPAVPSQMPRPERISISMPIRSAKTPAQVEPASLGRSNGRGLESAFTDPKPALPAPVSAPRGAITLRSSNAGQAAMRSGGSGKIQLKPAQTTGINGAVEGLPPTLTETVTTDTSPSGPSKTEPKSKTKDRVKIKAKDSALASGPSSPAKSKDGANGHLANDSVRGQIKSALAEVLFVDAGKIDEALPMSDLGLDSILVVEVVKKLNEALQLNLKATKLYDYPTVDELSKFLAAELKAARATAQGEGDL